MSTIVRDVFLAVLLLGLNVVAVMVMTGKNPIIGVWSDFFHRRPIAVQHKDNLLVRIYGYFLAAFVLLLDVGVVLLLIDAVFK